MIIDVRPTPALQRRRPQLARAAVGLVLSAASVYGVSHLGLHLDDHRQVEVVVSVKPAH